MKNSKVNSIIKMAAMSMFFFAVSPAIVCAHTTGHIGRYALAFTPGSYIAHAHHPAYNKAS